MLISKLAVLVTGLVLVLGQVSANCGCDCGCSCGCSSGLQGGSYALSGGCGLGPGEDWCSTCGRRSGLWDSSRSLTGGIRGIVGLEGGKGSLTAEGVIDNSAPIVVRPQDIPKPAIALPLGLEPLPTPCVCKKAIVKPAKLPKPVCRIPYGTAASGYSSSGSCCQSNVCGTTLGAVGYGPIVEGNVACNPADLTPADAVSLSLAFQTAQQCSQIPCEDRLTFGFRKIPEELPPAQMVYRQTIPEEQIFCMNGQIVELKPVKVCNNKKSLEEEAQEELLALEEESVDANTCGSGCGYRCLTLGQIGYAPANLDKKFVDVPATAISSLVSGAASALVSEAAGAISSAVGDLTGKCDGFAPGNVIYKTVPKLTQLVTSNPPEVPPDDTECESSEDHQSVTYEEPAVGAIGGFGYCAAPAACCAAPCCAEQSVYHTSSCSSSCASTKKKASVLVQRLCK